MDFPIADLMDEKACYDKLVHWLHPGGLKCPKCRSDDRVPRPSSRARPDPRPTAAGGAIGSSTPTPGRRCRGRSVGPCR